MEELDELKHALSTVLGQVSEGPFPLHEPMIGHREAERAQLAIKSGMISSIGPAVGDFEGLLSSFTGVKNIVCVSSGTAALQIALYLAGVRSGDEVAIPALSFIATANAASFLGAKPVFFDVDPMTIEPTLGASAESFSELLTHYDMTDSGPKNRLTGARLAAVIPVHVFGRIATNEDLFETAASWKVRVVEDAAGAIGCFDDDGNHPGSRATSILSFNGNKTITTGGGGALLTQSDSLANIARHLASTAKISHPWKFDHDMIGWNFRMPAVNAAIGSAQLESIDTILRAKQKLYFSYQEAFANSRHFEFLSIPNAQKSNYWLNCIRLKEPSREVLGVLLDSINLEGYGARACWTPLHQQTPYLNSQRVDLSNANEVADSIICLPSSPSYGISR